MFRELIRKKKALPTEECIRILKTQKRGVLSVNGDDGFPYGMPMNHFYNDEDGKIYFHSGKIGHRLDSLRRDDKVSFCTFDEGYRLEGEWQLNIKSVIVFGKIAVVEDAARITDIMTKLSHKFTDDDEYIKSEIEENLKRTVLLELTPEHVCGKSVEES